MIFIYFILFTNNIISLSKTIVYLQSNIKKVIYAIDLALKLQIIGTHKIFSIGYIS